VPGPETGFGNTFYTSENISWSGLPGYILLGVDDTQHLISGDMPGCKYAFPADMDSDGDLDVVASQTLSWDRVMWFENDGAGGGWDEHEIAFNHSEVQCAYPGDLDNDGDMDVVGANSVSNRIEWWRNEDGVGDTWQMFTISDYFGNTYFACCADIDGDGVQEVVASSKGLDEIAWWESETTPPDSVWQKHVVSGTTDRCDEIYCIDLDQDGDMDILAAVRNDNTSATSFFENTDGVGLAWEEIVVLAPHTRTGWSIHAADVDGDAEIDVVACGEKDWKYPPYEHFLSWVENEGFGDSWEEHLITYDTWDVFLPTAVHAADLTSDGLVDIVCAEGSQSWDLTLWRNVDASENAFAELTLKTGPWFRDVDTADFDGDGKLDLLVAASSGGVNIRWFDIDPYLQGSLTSTILDAQGWPEWESIEWTSVEPEGTDITFQIRGSNDPDEMGAWSDTLTEPGSLEGHLDSAYRFVQYRVHLQADSGVLSPYLEEVSIGYGSMGVEGEEGVEPLSLSLSPNPFSESLAIEVSGFSGDVALRVYDISGRMLRELSPDESGLCEWDGRDRSGAAAPPGLYLLRAASGGGSARAGVVRF